MTEHTHKQPMRAHRIYENAAALGACEAERDQLKAEKAELVGALEAIKKEASVMKHPLVRVRERAADRIETWAATAIAKANT